MKFILLIILLSVPAVWQIITPGYFPMHDDTQVVRVQQMHKSIQGGQFPVRWAPDLGYGYGYPVFNFYNPLPYYFGTLFMFLGADALTATKAMMVFGIILAGVSMFVLTRAVLKGSDLSGRSDPSLWAALLASILYLYAPYHGVQIYVRGAVAEYWAYAILPLVFYAIWKKKIILAGISLAALITSHNLTAFMSIPFVGILMIIQLVKMNNKNLFHNSYSVIARSPRRGNLKLNTDRHGHVRRGLAMTFETSSKSLFLISCFLFLIFALSLSAFFWLPAIAEAGKTQVSQMVFGQFDPPAKHLITLRQLWSSPWGYGGSSPGLDDGLSLELGKIHLLGSLAAMVIWLYGYMDKKTVNHLNNLTIFAILGLFFSLFLLLPFSATIWNTFPVLAYIQFPWRFLTFASFFASILTAYSVINLNTGLIYFFGRAPANIRKLWRAGTPEPRTRALRQRGRRPRAEVSVVLGLSLLFLISSFKFFQPQFKYPTTAGEQTSREKIVWEVSRRSDEYLPKEFERPKNLEEALRGGNLYNQRVVDDIKKTTPVRRLANTISLISLISLITLIPYAIFRRVRTA